MKSLLKNRLFFLSIPAMLFFLCVGNFFNGAAKNDSRQAEYADDSTFTERQKLTADDGGANENFGISVHISGNTAIVGASNDRIGANFRQGSAYIFVRATDGTWTQQAKLVASDGAAENYFGNSVHISGDTAIVGASGGFFSTTLNGAVYVFVRNGTTWTEQQKLTASDGAAGDNFGWKVGVSGNTLTVGAPLDDIGANSNQGSAYIFVRNGASWTEQTKLTAANGATGAQFGNSVAISGETVVVGTPSENRGSAYIFVRNGATWAQQQKLTASDNAVSSFGYSVAISGETVIVGKSGSSLPNSPPAAYIFVRSGAAWSEQQKLTASVTASDFFGISVGLSGNTAIIGTFNLSTAGSGLGAAYIFTRSGTSWSEQQRLVAADGATDDFFGFDVAISGNKVISGGYGDDLPTNLNQGSAYIFEAPAAPTSALFDYDGDGKADISIFRPAPGEWWINRSSNGSTFAAQFGTTSDKIVPADYTGDGKTDVAFWRPSNGQWFILRSEDFSFFAFPFGANGDIPVPADYDGDGKADAAVFRPSNLTWFISKSTGGTDIITFGATGDLPTVADYDGDSKADIAIYRPAGTSGSEWWIRRSSNATVFATQFGTPTDKPVQGDYTGDGKADVAFWRPSNGNWFILRSEDFSFFAFPFGANGDVPVAGDYDGDGKFDAAVFRPSNLTWFIQRSTAGTLIQQFGITGDLPTPSAFLP